MCDSFTLVTSPRCVKFRGNSEEPWKMLVSVMGLRHSMRTLGSWCCSPLWPHVPQLSGVFLGIFKRFFACGKLAMVGTVCRSLMSDQMPERRPGLAFPKIMAILRQKEIKSGTWQWPQAVCGLGPLHSRAASQRDQVQSSVMLRRPPLGTQLMYPQHCLGHLAAIGRMFLRRLESPGELSGKAALGSSGCVGSPQRTNTQGQGLQWPLSPLEGRSGADFRGGSLFPKDELYPSRQRCDSPGNLRSYMTPKHQPGPRP